MSGDMARLWHENDGAGLPRLTSPDQLHADGIQRLGEALCYEAGEDYRRARGVIRKLNEMGVKVDDNTRDHLKACRQFFLSEFFYSLTGLDGRAVLESLDRQMNQDEEERRRRKHRQPPNQ